MSEDEVQPIRPKPVTVAALMIGTIAASVSISALVIDTDSPPSELPGSVELVYRSAVAPAQGLARVDAQCPLGKVVTGGGTYADAESPTLLVLDNTPLRNGRRYAWRARFSNKSAREIAVGSVAVCAKAAARGSTSRADAPSRSVTTGPTTRERSPATTTGAQRP